jgi:citrate/tricarballylate utilization protein
MTRRLDFGKRRHPLPRQPVPQLRRLPACLPVRAAARVRGQRAAARWRRCGSAHLQDYAWPPALGALYRAQRRHRGAGAAGGLALFLMLALAMRGTLLHEPLAGNFYAVFPHNLMVALFGACSCSRCWRWPSACGEVLARSVRRAIRRYRRRQGARRRGRRPSPTSRLTYLDGGHGDGCNEDDDRFTLWRRRFHHLTFYGFLLCFAATCVATLYHYAVRAARALCGHQPAGAARHARRHRPAGRAGRPAVAEPAPRSAAWRPAAAADGPRLHRAAVRRQRHRPGAAAWRDTGAMALLLACTWAP